MAEPVPSRCDPSCRHATGLTRRRALSGAAVVGLAAPVLAACGGDGGTADDPAPTAPASPASDGPLAAASDVPVGSGLILEDQGVVLTQPTEGEILAFSNICTHQGCPVSTVSEDGIGCTCHGSVFSLADGAPVDGPATEPLAAVEISVEGGDVTLA